MSKQKLLDMYSPVMPDKKANAFVDQVFSKFDTDNSGTIDFKVRFYMKTLIHFWKMLQEFMLATNVAEAQSAEDKLRSAFKMYDRDGSGLCQETHRAQLDVCFRNNRLD